MADDPRKTGLDRKLISLNEPHEVRSWTESLGCTEKQLKDAVAAVGNSAHKVREYLKESNAVATSTKATAAERASFEDAKNRLIESLKSTPRKPAKRAASSGAKTKPPTAAAKAVARRNATS